VSPTIAAAPWVWQINVSGVSSRMLIDHGGSSISRSTKAPRALTPSSNPTTASTPRAYRVFAPIGVCWVVPYGHAVEGNVKMSRRRWPREADHYYWITAYFAARDMQATLCRVVAASMFSLGVIPLLLMLSPVGPQGLLGRVLAVVVAVCCLVMGLLWLRHSWPTRTESQVCILVGTACILVSCSIVANPVVGVLGATTFAVLSAFTMFFHSFRLLAVVWTVCAATLAVLVVRLASIDTALAISSVVLVALINVFVAVACRMAVRMIDTETRYGDIEPLTGLLNRDAFFERATTLIGAHGRSDDRFLVVMVVFLDGFSLLTDMAGTRGGNRARVAIGQRLREAVRRETILAHVGEAEFLIAELFTAPDPDPLIQRIRSTVNTAPFRLTTSIGVVTTPLRPLADHPSPDVVEELLTIATAAMFDARKGGGDQAVVRLSPALSVLQESSDDLGDTDRSA
jgi:diguanylate cyclase (GGDEF)-like protein